MSIGQLFAIQTLARHVEDYLYAQCTVRLDSSSGTLYSLHRITIWDIQYLWDLIERVAEQRAWEEFLQWQLNQVFRQEALLDYWYQHGSLDSDSD